MDPKLVTLITGSRKGIGRHLAEHYLERGHIVYGCSREKSDLNLENYHHVCLDVSDENEVRGMFSRIRKEVGKLDHLINNAGIASMNHAMLTPLASVKQIFDTNFMGTFLFCREAAKMMQTKNYGRIVNFITVATPLKLEGEAVYAASKAAVQNLTQILAREFAPFKVTVNAIGPTPIATDLIRSVPKKKIDELIARQAIGRLGTEKDVANVIDFYLRKESDFVTGQSIFLGGIS